MDNIIGQRIKKRRKELHITQTQIQEQTSISPGNLSCIENGKYLPSAIALTELSKVLDCSVDWILTGNSPVKENCICSNTHENVQELLDIFCVLSYEDQDELLQIARIKANKSKRAQNLESHQSQGTDTA
jgi:transcriptional regulator with XRE-family HTH domain